MSRPAGDKYNLLSWLSRKINYPLVSPAVIQVSLTYRCNLRCKMCRIAELLPEDEELSTRQILHIIDEAAKNGITEAVFTGGEPFLREDLFELCAYCHHKGLTSVITTNGILIDEDMAEMIIKAKVSHIHFSLDGLEESNDFFRGRDAFKRTTEAIGLLNREKRENGSFSTGVACTVMDRNVRELYELLRLADGLGVDVINFQPLVGDNANFPAGGSSDYWVRDGGVSALKEDIAKIRNFKPAHIAIYEEPHLELLIKYYLGELTRRDWVCFGGFKTVFISYSKKRPLVYSCHGICGDIDQVCLREAWTSKEAYRLRLSSRKCRNLCMQSCYSQESAQGLGSLAGAVIKRAAVTRRRSEN